MFGKYSLRILKDFSALVSLPRERRRRPRDRDWGWLRGLAGRGGAAGGAGAALRETAAFGRRLQGRVLPWLGFPSASPAMAWFPFCVPCRGLVSLLCPLLGECGKRGHVPGGGLAFGALRSPGKSGRRWLLLGRSVSRAPGAMPWAGRMAVCLSIAPGVAAGSMRTHHPRSPWLAVAAVCFGSPAGLRGPAPRPGYSPRARQKSGGVHLAGATQGFWGVPGPRFGGASPARGTAGAGAEHICNRAAPQLLRPREVFTIYASRG